VIGNDFVREALAELLRRRTAGLALYEPMAEQERFHACQAKIRVFRGGVRSGKSMACYVEVARAALGKDPYNKYPTNRPLDIWIVCYEESNIGRTVYRYLFEPGAYKIIRDLQTGQWRAFRPWLPEDQTREHEAMPSNPLIPPECVREIAWRAKKDRIFASVVIDPGPDHPMNGTRIRVFSSGREPPQSDPVDLVMIDEDLKYERFVPELVSRLADRKGRLIWAVFPHTKNNALINLHRIAEQEKEKPDPTVVEFRGIFSNNIHLDAKERERTLRLWSEEERRARDQGEFALDNVLVYPTFDHLVHSLPQFLAGQPRSPLDAAWASGNPPDDWTLYAAIDPGHTVAAALFVAVAPPSFGDYVVAFDELYLRNCEASYFARKFAEKVKGRPWEAFFIDMRGAQTGTAGKSYSALAIYKKEFKELGVMAARPGFIPGSADVAGRVALVREWLLPRQQPHGLLPKFFYLRHKCPNLEREFGLYKKRVGRDGINDMPIPADNHLMDCLGYLAAGKIGHVSEKRIRGSRYDEMQKIINDSKKPFVGKVIFASGRVHTWN